MKIAEWTYRVVLRLYPNSFRREFAGDMTQFFVDRLRQAARERKPWRVMRYWCRGLYDAAIQGLREHHQERRVRTNSVRERPRPHMGILLQDLKYAIRTLVKTPAFTAVTVVTLGLGVGANTAVFSVIYGVLLKPLPYADSGRLVRAFTEFPSLGFDHFWLSWGEYLLLRDQNKAFEEVAAYGHTRSVSLSAIDAPTRLRGTAISATLLPTLGVNPVLGRNFTPEEDLPAGEAVIILGHGLWRREFGASAEVLGRTVQLNGVARRVVGVMPAGFRLPTEFDAPAPAEIFIPLARDPANTTAVGGHNYNVVGRLLPGATVQAADASLKEMAQHIREQFPFPDDFSGKAVALLDRVVGDVRPALFVLLGTVGFVLLVACANVANLMLARAESRHREVAVRMALGAGRGRLLRQLLTESMLLSVLGGAVAIAFAVFGVRALLAVDPTSIPRADSVALNLPVLAFTIGVSVFTGLLFGVVPSLHATTPDLQAVLKEGDRGATVGASRLGLRRALAVSEVALALLLTVGAGLMIKSFWILNSVDPGLDPERVLTVNVSLPATSYPDGPAVGAYYDRALERVSALPGVADVAMISTLQFGGNNYDWTFRIEDRPTPPGEIGPNADYRLVSHDYFSAIGIPVVRGRGLTEFDRDSANPAIVINEMMAERFWPDEEAVGKRLGLLNNTWHEVVGVVSDVRSRGLVEDPRPEMFLEQRQSRALGVNTRTFNFVIRTAGDPLALANSVRGVFRALDPDIPVGDVRTVEQLVSESISQERFSMLLLAIFAGVALLLAAIGIYGIMAYSVAQRTQELGVRMALGADASTVRSLVLRQGMRVAGVGLALGLGLAIAMTRLLESLLFSVSTTDPAIFGAVAALLAGVAFVANYIPALRASRGDPLAALREE